MRGREFDGELRVSELRVERDRKMKGKTGHKDKEERRPRSMGTTGTDITKENNQIIRMNIYNSELTKLPFVFVVL